MPMVGPGPFRGSARLTAFGLLVHEPGRVVLRAPVPMGATSNKRRQSGDLAMMWHLDGSGTAKWFAERALQQNSAPGGPGSASSHGRPRTNRSSRGAAGAESESDSVRRLPQRHIWRFGRPRRLGYALTGVQTAVQAAQVYRAAHVDKSPPKRTTNSPSLQNSEGSRTPHYTYRYPNEFVAHDKNLSRSVLPFRVGDGIGARKLRRCDSRFGNWNGA